jgi:hypothetical protein
MSKDPPTPPLVPPRSPGIGTKNYHAFQAAGDIIVVGATMPVSINLFFQLILTRKLSTYAHVLLCVIPGLYLHSTPKFGVHFLYAEELAANFVRRYDKRWRAYRNKRLARDAQLAAAFKERAQFYVGQLYNWAFFGKRLRGYTFETAHSFCSEYVARVFKDIGLAFPINTGDRMERALPNDLYHSIQANEDWDDVTQNYLRMYQSENLHSGIADFDRVTRFFFIYGAINRLGSSMSVARLTREGDRIISEIGRLLETYPNADEKTKSTIKEWYAQWSEEWIEELDALSAKFTVIPQGPKMALGMLN